MAESGEPSEKQAGTDISYFYLKLKSNINVY